MRGEFFFLFVMGIGLWLPISYEEMLSELIKNGIKFM